MKAHDLRLLGVVWVALLMGLPACQRETPADKAPPPQPASTVDRAAQESVEAIKTPMDKARGVENTLGESADRTADRVKETTQ